MLMASMPPTSQVVTGASCSSFQSTSANPSVSYENCYLAFQETAK